MALDTITSFSPLKSIFDDDHVEKVPGPVQPRMKCLWCETVVSEAHATRIISHLVWHTNENV